VALHHLIGSFDPKTLSAVCAAFDEAWKVVADEVDPSNRDAVREKMALAIIARAKGGETDVARLTACAVARAVGS
jgi:hypothetical protein